MQKVWTRAIGQVTAIPDMPAKARRIRFDDTGNNNQISTTDGDDDLGLAVELMSRMGRTASTEPDRRSLK